jgi:tRNA 5-methylaminomethyl-2-thiouridine biosynthesis bifunctional protein
LHISSIEAFLLEREDAARALAPFAEVADLAARLIECWPVRAYGAQRLWFEEERLALTLHIGDVEAVLAGWEGSFDAWYLDGFAPSRNPAMWSERVFAEIARLSAPQASLATFSVAGEVRRGLERAGFAVEKKPGFASKRERLEARFISSDDKAPSASPFPYRACMPGRVAVIGAGIAGAACAQALLRCGVDTSVFDAGDSLGAGASGNPAGLAMPRLDRGGALQSFFVSAFLFAVRQYESFGAFLARGVEERTDGRRAAALADLVEDPPLPGDWFSPRGDGAFYARAGLVDARAAVAAMLAGAELRLNAPVADLAREQNRWSLLGGDGSPLGVFDAVVIAGGAALGRFAALRFLPLQLTPGQIEWGQGRPPPHAIAAGSYVAPLDRDAVLFGATFDRVASEALDAQAFADARLRNLAALAQIAPDCALNLDAESLQSRAALRASTPDRAPIAGLVPDADAWLAAFAAIAHGGPIPNTRAPAHDGLYVLGGLGARGLVTAPILGERLAAEMCAQPQMLSRSELDALHPARFLLRSLRRGGA